VEAKQEERTMKWNRRGSMLKRRIILLRSWDIPGGEGGGENRDQAYPKKLI